MPARWIEYVNPVTSERERASTLSALGRVAEQVEQDVPGAAAVLEWFCRDRVRQREIMEIRCAPRAVLLSIIAKGAARRGTVYLHR